MRRAVLAAVAAFVPALPVFAGASAAARPAPPAANAQSSGSLIDLSLIEALKAVRQPHLAGLFSFISEKDAPYAFADYLARDPKSLKAYLGKLGGDLKAAKGLTDWDHGVCASLVNLYASPQSNYFGKPDPKRVKQLNACVLSPILTLETIVQRRDR